MGISARKEREKKHRRQTILAAARELFFKKGYRTTMEEIAERAELSKGTLYIYFKSKDELYISVILEGFHLLEKRMEEAVKGAVGVEEKIRAIYYSFIDHCLENREYFRITQYFLTEEARSNTSSELIETINRSTADLLERGVEAIRWGIETGDLSNDLNPSAYAVVVWRAATGILDLAVLEEDTGRKGVYRELFDIAIEALLEGARAKA